MTSCSRLVQFQQIKRNWLKHQDRLIHIKSTLKTRLPASKVLSTRRTNFNHSLQVELQNKALLKKLTDRGHQRQEVSMVCQSANQLPKSNRKRYYQDYKIKCQNQGLYRRLKQTKPMLDLSALRIQRAQTEKLLNTISKFGYKNFKPTKTLMKFEMANNELKYLSRRRILIDQKLKDQQTSNVKSDLSSEKIIEEQLQRHKKSEKLFTFFSRFRHIEIDNQEATLKITRGSSSIMIQLSKLSDKENEGDLQVSIPKELFKQRYNQNLQELISKLKYDYQSKLFYIL